jgi:diacylglycerol kinase family enzyme
MHIAVVHNPTSGDAHPTRDELLATLARHGYQADYYSSVREWRQEVGESPELVVVAGGDGTIRKMARQVANATLPLTILPLGTANNVARALGLTDRPIDELVGGWSAGTIRRFDLGTVEGPWGSDLFLESAGVGVLAETMHEIDNGGSGYVNTLEGADVRMSAALDVLEAVAAKSSPFRARLVIDDRTIEGEYVLVETLNFGGAGPNLQFSPDGTPHDAMLDVVVVGWNERERLVDFVASRRGGAADPSRLAGIRAHRVQVNASRGPLHVDDRLITFANERPFAGALAQADAFRFDAAVRPAALSFLIPAFATDAGNPSDGPALRHTA